MFVLANFFYFLAQLLELVLTLYTYAVIARAVISWFNVSPYNPLVQFLRRITDPVLYQIQKFVPSAAGMDFSPLVLILILYFLKSFLVTTLINIAYAFR